MKTKYAQGAQRVSAAMGDTSKPPVSVKLPSAGALPTAADNRSYMYETPNAHVVAPQDSQSLPMFSTTAGNTDSGVSHQGDLGGAA